MKYWDNNVIGTINLLNVMQKNNCKNLIFSSSATIYKTAERKNIKECSEISPTNTYGDTKSTIENILKSLFKSEPNEWKIANLRYFNPIGAHKSGLIGEQPIEFQIIYFQFFESCK